ncbi:MAG: LPS-assembly lipoprotein LptE [Panacagrimonas sp.]
MLTACGFNVAGSRSLPEPLKRVHIDTVVPYRVSEPPVELALRTRLTRRGAEVVEKIHDGVTVIRLTELTESRQVLSVGADGKALEFQLILRVAFDVRSGEKVWVPPDEIEVRRDYSFNAQQILAKEQEAERLRAFMQDEMAELLLLRIEAAVHRAATAPPEPPPGAVPAVQVVPTG